MRFTYLALQSKWAAENHVCASALAALPPDSALIAAAASTTTCSRIARYSRERIALGYLDKPRCLQHFQMTAQVAVRQSTQLLEGSERQTFRMSYERGEQAEARTLVDHPIKSVVSKTMRSQWLEATSGHLFHRSAKKRQQVAVPHRMGHPLPRERMPARRRPEQGR